MILTNSVGSVLEIFYCFLLFRAASSSNQSSRLLFPVGGAAAFCFFVIAVIHVRGSVDSIDVLGSVNVIVNVATFATPLLTVREVIR